MIHSHSPRNRGLRNASMLALGDHRERAKGRKPESVRAPSNFSFLRLSRAFVSAILLLLAKLPLEQYSVLPHGFGRNFRTIRPDRKLQRAMGGRRSGWLPREVGQRGAQQGDCVVRGSVEIVKFPRAASAVAEVRAGAAVLIGDQRDRASDLIRAPAASGISVIDQVAARPVHCDSAWLLKAGPSMQM